jgi:predicted metal-dependent hydrolase
MTKFKMVEMNVDQEGIEVNCPFNLERQRKIIDMIMKKGEWFRKDLNKTESIKGFAELADGSICAIFPDVRYFTLARVNPYKAEDGDEILVVSNSSHGGVVEPSKVENFNKAVEKYNYDMSQPFALTDRSIVRYWLLEKALV